MTENIFEYIKILLPRHKCITLPGLGAFILNKEENNFIEDRSTINPPSYSITFNSMLQHDDGTLSSYIQSLKNTSYDKANKDLAVAVREMRAKLLSNQEITCSSLGSLRLIDGITVFTQNRDYVSPIHFGLSPIRLNSIATINQDIRRETKTIGLKKRLVSIAASAAVVALLALSSTSITDSTEQGGNQQAGYLSSLVASRTNYTAKETNSEREALINNVEAKYLDTEATTKTEVTTAIQPVASKVKPKSGRTYYLIVGGEPTADGAALSLEQFKKEGFATAKILASSERHRIYIETFETIGDAERAVTKFRQENPKYTTAWIHSARN